MSNSIFDTLVFAVLTAIGILNAIMASYDVYHLLAYLCTRGNKAVSGCLPRSEDCEAVGAVGTQSRVDEDKETDLDASTRTALSSDISSSGAEAVATKDDNWEPDPTVEYPMVTIQACAYNEMSCIEALLRNLAKIHWPQEKLQIQLLDDSTMPEAVDLADCVIADLKTKGLHHIEHCRRQNRYGYKAGNLLHHFESVRGLYVAIFDSDFLPYPDYLLKTIPHFYDKQGQAKEDVGLIQTTWDHFNQTDNLFTQAQGLIQNFHFVIQQNVRYRCNGFIPFNGTAGVWKTEAIAKSGGWNYDTVTEDLDMACRAKLHGYELIYLEHVTVPSELPPTMMAYKRQQRRWTQGHMQVGRKVIRAVWNNETFSTKLKIDLTHCTLHKVNWLSAFVGLLVTPLLGFVQLSPVQIIIVSVLGLYGLAIWLVLLSMTLWDKKFTHPTMSPTARMGRLYVIPCFILLHIGMTLWNFVSVIEGWIQNDIPFATTPKKGNNSGVNEDAIQRQAKIDDADIELLENQNGEQDYKEWHYDGWGTAASNEAPNKVKRRPPGKLSKSFPQWAHFVELLLAFYFLFVGLFYDNQIFALPIMVLSIGFFWVSLPGIRTSLCKAFTCF